MSTVDYILDLLYPPTCLVCGELQVPGTKVPLCRSCQQKWEELRRSTCPLCKQPQTLCQCVPPLLSDLARNVACVHLVPYEQNSVAGRLLLTAKDERLPRLTNFFADELQAVLAVRDIPSNSDKPVLTYLPRSRDRAFEKGVDPSKALAKALGERIGIEMTECFARRNAPPQKEMGVTERLRSARRTYRLRKRCPSLEGATVLLVDDILTTGATMLAGVELLSAAGAKKICCITVGHSIEKIEKGKNHRNS